MSWRTETLGNLLAPSGNTRAGDQDLPVLSITMHGGLVDQSEKFKKRVASPDVSDYRVVYTNELVVGFPIDEGVLGFQTRYPAAVVSPAYGVWKLRKPAETHIPFVEDYLRSSEARKIYSKKMRGAVARRRSMTRNDFLEIEIPFPPLDERKRIAALLVKADRLRRQRLESLQLTEKLVRSVFLDMFGDPVTNPKQWRQVSLTQVCRAISGGTPSKSNPDFWHGKLPWFTPKDLKSDELLDSIDHISESVPDTTNLRLFPADTVLIVVRGMILAHSFPVSVIKTPGVINQDIKALIPDESVRSEFLAACLRAQKHFALTKVTTAGHGTKRLDSEGLSQLKIVIPNIDLQDRFIAALSFQRAVLQRQRLFLDHSTSFFTSLQQRAFHGELDLSRVVLDTPVDAPPAMEPEKPATKAAKIETGALLLQAPQATEAAFKAHDDTVSKGDLIPWSADYFKYRILGKQPAPFSFREVMQRAEAVFDEPPPYEEIKNMILELLGQGEGQALLNQRFDFQIDANTKDITGRKEIVFEPTA